MEGNLSGERFPSFGFLHPLLWHPADRKSGMVGTSCQRGSSGNVMERRGGSQRSIRMAPSSFSYERRLGLWLPYELGNRIPLLRKEKSIPSRMAHSAPCFKRFRWRPRGQRKRGCRYKGASPASAWLSPCGARGSALARIGKAFWVRPRFRLASVRASVCRPVCWKGP